LEIRSGAGKTMGRPVRPPGPHRTYSRLMVYAKYQELAAISRLLPTEQRALRQCFRLMVKRGLTFAASSIRRRSAAWTILLDWMYRSRRPEFELWMTQTRSIGQ